MNENVIPKRVAFDIGNVLCHVDIDEFFEFLVTQNVADSKKQAFEFMSDIQNPQDLGLYNIKQGFSKFNPQLDKNTIQTLYDAWIDIARPSIVMLDLVEELLNKHGYEVALLSNIGVDHSDILRQKCPIFNRCNQHFSCEVGARKPTKLFYQSFILQYVWNRDVLFFDDRLENIQAANGYLTGVLFDIEKYDTDEAAAQVIRNHLGL